MKQTIVKLEDFSVKVNKLKFGQIKKILKEMLSLKDELASLDPEKIVAEIVNNPEKFEKIILEIVEIPKENSLDDMYPDDFLTLYPKVMEVNNNFLELLTGALSSQTQSTVPQSKNSIKA